MKNEKGVVSVAPEHIEKGITKYGGKVDPSLAAIIKSAGLEYTPYQFIDGRILLVLPDNLAAFLYEDKETLFRVLSLEV